MSARQRLEKAEKKVILKHQDKSNYVNINILQPRMHAKSAPSKLSLQFFVTSQRSVNKLYTAQLIISTLCYNERIPELAELGTWQKLCILISE